MFVKNISFTLLSDNVSFGKIQNDIRKECYLVI